MIPQIQSFVEHATNNVCYTQMVFHLVFRLLLVIVKMLHWPPLNSIHQVFLHLSYFLCSVWQKICDPSKDVPVDIVIVWHMKEPIIVRHLVRCFSTVISPHIFQFGINANSWLVTMSSISFEHLCLNPCHWYTRLEWAKRGSACFVRW